jgi:uncharacterized iron-regulated protein
MKQYRLNYWLKLAGGLFLCLFGFLVSGCAGTPKGVKFSDSRDSYPQGSIILASTGKSITFDDLVSELMGVPLVFIGERHTDPSHHSVQLKIIREMHRNDPSLIIGMEMFDQSYQHVLDLWSSGRLDRQMFLEKTHWYANWRFRYGLYQDILDFIKENRIKVVGLNVPFHIPPKIAVGGMDSLLPEEKKYLPKQIDTSNDAHRAYVKKIFDRHQVIGRKNFDFFYQAQCVWEEIMAETIAANLAAHRMIVLAGNGHIINRFGIPDRVVRRVPSELRTIYLTPAGGTIERSFADYIWVTPPAQKHPRKTRSHR